MTRAPLPKQNLHTSTYPGAEEAPECLCAADAQAKQEGTGDRHGGLPMQTHINGPLSMRIEFAIPRFK